MTCCDHIRAFKLGSFKKLVEFKIFITFYAGIGSSALNIGLGKIINYAPLEAVGKIVYAVLDAEIVTGRSCIRNIPVGSAGAVGILILAWGIELHRSAEKLVTAFLYKISTNRAVYTSAHCNRNFLFSHQHSSQENCVGVPVSTRFENSS